MSATNTKTKAVSFESIREENGNRPTVLNAATLWQENGGDADKLKRHITGYNNIRSHIAKSFPEMEADKAGKKKGTFVSASQRDADLNMIDAKLAKFRDSYQTIIEASRAYEASVRLENKINKILA